MIDTTPYEGHTNMTDEELADAIECIQGCTFDDDARFKVAEANSNLMLDAPFLLKEVVRLQEKLDTIQSFILTEVRAYTNSNTYDHICHAVEKKLEAIE